MKRWDEKGGGSSDRRIENTSEIGVKKGGAYRGA